MVRVAVPGAALVRFTGVVDPKLRVGGSTPPAGLMTAVSTTLPLNPPVDVKVMVEVFPLVAPAATVTGVPATVKPGVTRLMV
jgi:hypothetical protein